MAENLFSRYLKFYKEKSQEEIKKDVIKTGKELIDFFSEDAYFVYFGVLILSFADGSADREELDFVNYVNDTLKLGHEHVSPDDGVEKMNELVNGNVDDWVLEFHAAREFADSYFKERYQNMIKFMCGCLSYKKSISTKELKFLMMIGANSLVGKNLEYDLSKKEEKKQPKPAEKASKQTEKPITRAYILVLNEFDEELVDSEIKLLGLSTSMHDLHTKMFEDMKSVIPYTYTDESDYDFSYNKQTQMVEGIEKDCSTTANYYAILPLNISDTTNFVCIKAGAYQEGFPQLSTFFGPTYFESKEQFFKFVDKFDWEDYGIDDYEIDEDSLCVKTKEGYETNTVYKLIDISEFAKTNKNKDSKTEKSSNKGDGKRISGISNPHKFKICETKLRDGTIVEIPVVTSIQNLRDLEAEALFFDEEYDFDENKIPYFQINGDDADFDELLEEMMNAVKNSIHGDTEEIDSFDFDKFIQYNDDSLIYELCVMSFNKDLFIDDPIESPLCREIKDEDFKLYKAGERIDDIDHYVYRIGVSEITNAPNVFSKKFFESTSDRFFVKYENKVYYVGIF